MVSRESASGKTQHLYITDLTTLAATPIGFANTTVCTMPIVSDSIRDTLSLLRQHLESRLNGLQALAADSVVVGNIALRESNNPDNTPDVAGKIVITLVKTEEEFALKNQPNHRRHPVTGNLEMVDPPVFLNLYLLIVPNVDDYTTALTFLSRIIGVFQHQRVFDENNTEWASLGNTDPLPIQHFQFNMQMLSPTFEQLNHLWGIAGGKLLPSVLYKLQLQKLEYVADEVRPGSPITEIVLNEQII